MKPPTRRVVGPALLMSDQRMASSGNGGVVAPRRAL